MERTCGCGDIFTSDEDMESHLIDIHGEDMGHEAPCPYSDAAGYVPMGEVGCTCPKREIERQQKLLAGAAAGRPSYGSREMV